MVKIGPITQADRIISTASAGTIRRDRLIRKFLRSSLSALPEIRNPLNAKNMIRME
jgi:hypothetical protein